MFCIHCGKEIEDGVKFCPFCGKNVAGEVTPGFAEKAATDFAKKPVAKTKAGKIFGVVAVVVVLVGGCIGGVLFYNSDEQKAKRSMRQADEFISEGNYEEAISSYKQVLTFDDENEDAYLGIADAYRSEEKYEEELQALEDGIDATGSPRLKERYEETRDDLLEEVYQAYFEYINKLDSDYHIGEKYTFIQLDGDIIPELYFYHDFDYGISILCYHNKEVSCIGEWCRADFDYNPRTGDYFYYQNSGGDMYWDAGWCHFENGKVKVEEYAYRCDYDFMIGRPEHEVDEETFWDYYEEVTSSHVYSDKPYENERGTLREAFLDYHALL